MSTKTKIHHKARVGQAQEIQAREKITSRQTMRSTRSLFLRHLLQSLVLTLLLGVAPAYSANLIIENAGISIPLVSGTIVTFDIDGNVSAQCLPNGSGGCTGLPNATGISVVLSSNVTTIPRNGTVNVTWTPDQGAVVCLAFSSPAVTAWDGPKSGTAGTQELTFTVAGTFTLFMECYNDDGSAGAVSRTITVT